MSYLDDLKSAIGEDVSFIERPPQKKTPNQKATEQINQLANVLGSEDSSNLKTTQKEATADSSKLDLTKIESALNKPLKLTEREIIPEETKKEPELTREDVDPSPSLFDGEEVPPEDLPPEEPTVNNVDSNFVQSLVVAQTQASTSKAIAQALTAKDNPTLPIKGVLATYGSVSLEEAPVIEPSLNFANSNVVNNLPVSQRNNSVQNKEIKRVLDNKLVTPVNNDNVVNASVFASTVSGTTIYRAPVRTEGVEYNDATAVAGGGSNTVPISNSTLNSELSNRVKKISFLDTNYDYYKNLSTDPTNVFEAGLVSKVADNYPNDSMNTISPFALESDVVMDEVTNVRNKRNRTITDLQNTSSIKFKMGDNQYPPDTFTNSSKRYYVTRDSNGNNIYKDYSLVTELSTASNSETNPLLASNFGQNLDTKEGNLSVPSSVKYFTKTTGTKAWGEVTSNQQAAASELDNKIENDNDYVRNAIVAKVLDDTLEMTDVTDPHSTDVPAPVVEYDFTNADITTEYGITVPAPTKYFDFKNTRLTDASEAAAANSEMANITMDGGSFPTAFTTSTKRLTYGIHANAPTGRTLGDLSVWTSGKTKILEDGTDSGISEDLFDGDIGLTFKTNRTVSYTPFATRPSWTVEFSYKWTDINSSTQGRIFGFGNFPGNAWVGGGRRFVNIYRQTDKITIHIEEANGGNTITTKKYIKSKTTTPTVSDPHFPQLAHLGNSPDDYIHLTITEDERSDSDERMKIYVNGVKLLDLDNDYSVGTTGVAYNENGLSNADVFTDGQTTGANGTVQYNAFVPFFWPNENGVTVGLDGSDGGAMSHMRLWFYDTNDSILTDAQVEALYHSWLGTVKFNKPTNSNFEKLNIEGLPNQVKLNENGIKIGKNSWLTSSVPPSLGNTFTAEFLVKNVTKSLTNKHVPYFFMGNKTAGLDFYDAISGPTNSSTKIKDEYFSLDRQIRSYTKDALSFSSTDKVYDYSYGIDSNTSVTSANRSISQIGADNSDDVYSHVVLVSKGNEAPEVYVDGEKKGTSFRPPFKNYDFRTCKFVTTDGLHPTIKFKNGDFATIMQKEDYKRRLKLDSKLGLMVDNYRDLPASAACPSVATSNFTLGTSFTFEFSVRVQDHSPEAYFFYMTGGTPSDYSYYGSHWGGVVGRKTITVQRSSDDRLWVRLQTWNSSGGVEATAWFVSDIYPVIWQSNYVDKIQMTMDHHIMIKIETSDTAFNGIHAGDVSMKMYWDGEEVSVTQYSSSGSLPVYTPGVEWAARTFVTGNSSTYIRGSMTHFNVYDYGVSADEAHLIYNKFRTGYDYEAPPIRSYDFRGATASGVDKLAYTTFDAYPLRLQEIIFKTPVFRDDSFTNHKTNQWGDLSHKSAAYLVSGAMRSSTYGGYSTIPSGTLPTLSETGGVNIINNNQPRGVELDPFEFGEDFSIECVVKMNAYAASSGDSGGRLTIPDGQRIFEMTNDRYTGSTDTNYYTRYQDNVFFLGRVNTSNESSYYVGPNNHTDSLAVFYKGSSHGDVSPYIRSRFAYYTENLASKFGNTWYNDFIHVVLKIKAGRGRGVSNGSSFSAFDGTKGFIKMFINGQEVTLTQDINRSSESTSWNNRGFLQNRKEKRNHMLLGTSHYSIEQNTSGVGRTAGTTEIRYINFYDYYMSDDKAKNLYSNYAELNISNSIPKTVGKIQREKLYIGKSEISEYTESEKYFKFINFYDQPFSEKQVLSLYKNLENRNKNTAIKIRGNDSDGAESKLVWKDITKNYPLGVTKNTNPDVSRDYTNSDITDRDFKYTGDAITYVQPKERFDFRNAKKIDNTLVLPTNKTLNLEGNINKVTTSTSETVFDGDSYATLEEDFTLSDSYSFEMYFKKRARKGVKDYSNITDVRHLAKYEFEFRDNQATTRHDLRTVFFNNGMRGYMLLGAYNGSPTSSGATSNLSIDSTNGLRTTGETALAIPPWRTHKSFSIEMYFRRESTTWDIGSGFAMYNLDNYHDAGHWGHNGTSTGSNGSSYSTWSAGKSEYNNGIFMFLRGHAQSNGNVSNGWDGQGDSGANGLTINGSTASYTIFCHTGDSDTVTEDATTHPENSIREVDNSNWTRSANEFMHYVYVQHSDGTKEIFLNGVKTATQTHINTTSQLPKEITRDIHIISLGSPYKHNLSQGNFANIYTSNPTENTRFIRYYDRALTDLQIFNLAEKKDVVYAPLLKIPKQLGTLKNPTTRSANPAVVNKKYFEYNQGLTHDFQLGNMCSINSGTLTFPSGQTCTVNENYVTFKNEYARFHNTLNDTSTAQPIEIPGSQIGHLLDDITFEICFKIPPRSQQAAKYRILEIGDFTSGSHHRLGLWAERDGNKNVIVARVFSEGNGTGSSNPNESQDKTLIVESGGSWNPNCVNHLTDSRSFNIETGGFGYGTRPNSAGSMLLSHGWQHLVISFGSIDKTGDRRHFSMYLKGRRVNNGMDVRQEDSDTVLIDYGPFFEKMSYDTSNTNYKMVLGSHVSRWEYSDVDTNRDYGWHYHGNEDGYTSTIDIKFVKIYNGISMASTWTNATNGYSDPSLQRLFYDNYILENRNTTGDAVFSLCLKESEENENIYSMIKEHANIWLSFNKEDTLLENKARRQNTSPNSEHISVNFENNVGVVDGVLNFGFDPRKGAAVNMPSNFIRFAGAGTNMAEPQSDQSFTFATWFRVNHWDQYTDNQNTGIIAGASLNVALTQFWYLQSMYTKHADYRVGVNAGYDIITVIIGNATPLRYLDYDIQYKSSRDKWMHVALTRDKFEYFYLYINGRLVDKTDQPVTSGADAGHGNFYLGGRSVVNSAVGAGRFCGQMQDVYYSTQVCLTEKEIGVLMARGNYKNVQEFGRYPRGNNFAWTIPKEINQEVNPEDYAIVAYEKSNCNNNWNKTFDDEYTHVVVTNDTTAKTNNYMSGEKKIYINGQLYDTKYVKNHERGTTFDKSLASAINKYNHMRFGKTVKDHFEEEYTALKFVNYYDKALTTNEVANVFRDRHRETNEIIPVAYQKYYDFRKVTITGNSGVANNLIFHNGEKGTIEYTESDIFELSREDGFSALNDQNVDTTTYLGSGSPVVRTRADLEPFEFGGADFTFEFTLRFDSVRGSRDNERIIYFKGSNSVSVKRDGSNKRLELVFENSGATQSIKYTTGDCIVNDVMHVVVVYDYSSTTDVKIYINGTSQTITRSVTGSAGNDSTIFQSATRTNHYIGNDNGQYTGFTMKYLKYYSSALTATNVSDLYSLYSNGSSQKYPYPNILEFDFRSATIRSDKIISKNKKLGTLCGLNKPTIQITKSGEYLPVRIDEYEETVIRSFGSATGEIPQSTDASLSTGDGRTIFCRFMLPYGMSTDYGTSPAILKKNSSIISLNSVQLNYVNFDISGYSGSGDVQDTSGNNYDGSLLNGNPGANNGNSNYPPTFVSASGSTPAHFQLRNKANIRFDAGTNNLGVDFEIKIKFSIPDTHTSTPIYQALLTGNEYRANYGLAIYLYDRRPQVWVSQNTGYQWTQVLPTTGGSAAAQIPRNTITEFTLKHNSSGFFLFIDGVHVTGGPNLNYGSYSDNSVTWMIAGDETNDGNWEGHYDIYDVSFTKGPTTKLGATVQYKDSKYYIVPSIGLDLQDSAYADYHFDSNNSSTGSYTENQTKSEPKFEYEEEKWYTLAITTQFTEVSGGSNYIDNTMYINGVKQGDTYRIENNSSFTPTDLAEQVMGWVGSSQRYDSITLGRGNISEFIKIIVSDGAYFDYALTASQVAALSTGNNPNSSYISGLSSSLAPKWYQRTDGPRIQASGGIIDYRDQRISLGRHFITRAHTVEFSVRIHEDQLGSALFLSDTHPSGGSAWERLIQYNLINDHDRTPGTEYGGNASLAFALEIMRATNGTVDLQLWGFHPDGGNYATGSFNVGTLTFSQDQHFFIEMISNTHIKVYLNNSLVKTKTLTDTNDRLDNRTTKYNIVLGSVHSPGVTHSGIFEYKYTRIYDRELGKEERDALYNSRNTADIFTPSSLIKEYSKEVKNFDGSLATYTRNAKAEENYITPFDKKRQGFLINENYLTETNIPVSSNYSIEMAIRESDSLGGIYHDTDETLLHFHTKTGQNVDNTNQLQIRYKPDTDKLNIWYGNNDSHHIEVTETDYDLKDYIEPYYEFDFRKATKHSSNNYYTLEDGTQAKIVAATSNGLVSYSYSTYTKPSSIPDSDSGICTEESSTRKPLQISYSESRGEELKLHTNFTWEIVHCMVSNRYDLTSHHSWTYVMSWSGHLNGFFGEGNNFGKNLVSFAVFRKSTTSKLLITLYIKEINSVSDRYSNWSNIWDGVRYRTIEDVTEMFETCHTVITFDSTVKFQHGNETYGDGEVRNSPIKLLINGKNYDLMVDEDALTHNNIDLRRHTDRDHFKGMLNLGGTWEWGEFQGGDMFTYVNYYNKSLSNDGCRTLYQRYISSLKPIIDYDFRKCTLSNYRVNFEDGKYVDFEGQPYSFDFCRQDELDGIHLEGHSSLRLPPPPKIGRDFTVEFVGNFEFLPSGTSDSKAYSIFGFNNYGDSGSDEENWAFNQNVNLEDGSGSVNTQGVWSYYGNQDADEYFHIIKPGDGGGNVMRFLYIVYKPRGNPGGNGGDEWYAWHAGGSRAVEKIFSGDWCHIVFVYTQAQAPRLYVNGEHAFLDSAYSKQRGTTITEYRGANYKTFRPLQQNVILGHGIVNGYSSGAIPSVSELPKMNFRYIKVHNVGFDRQHCLRLYDNYQYENYKLMNKKLKHVVLTINSDTLTADANTEHELSVDKQKKESIKLYVDGKRKELVYDTFPELGSETALSNVTRELLVGAGLDSSGNKVLSKLDSSLVGFNTFNKELTELEIRELYTKHTKTNIEDYKADKMDKKECRETLLRPVEAYDFRKIKSMKASEITLENDRTIQAHRYDQNSESNVNHGIYLGRPAQPLHEFDFRNSYKDSVNTSSRNLYLKNSVFEVDAGNGWNNVTVPTNKFSGIVTPGGIIGEGFELHRRHTIEVYFRRVAASTNTSSFNVFNFTDLQGGKYSLQCGTVTTAGLSSFASLGTSIKIENTFGSTKSITLANDPDHVNGNYGVLCHIVIVIDTENTDNISVYTNGVKNNYTLDFAGDSLCDMPLHKRDKFEFGSSFGSQVREDTTANKEIKYLRYYDKCLGHSEIVDLYRAREHNYDHGMSVEINNKQGLAISEISDGTAENRMFVTSTNTPHYTGGSFTAEFTINSVDLDINPRRDQIYFSYSDSITGYEGSNSSGPEREAEQPRAAVARNGRGAGRTLALCGKITDTNHITGGMNANTKEGTLGFYLEDPSKTYSTTAPGTGSALKAYMPSNQHGPHTNVINSGWIHLAMSHDDDVIHQNDSFQTGLQGVRYYLNGEEITDKFERLYYTSETGTHVALGPKIKDRFLKIGKSDFDPQAQESFRTTMFRYYDRVLNPDEIKQKYTDYIKTDPYNFTNYNISENFNSAISGNKSYAERSDNGLDNYKLKGFNSLREKCEVNYKIDKDLPDDVVGEDKYAFEINPKGLGTSDDLTIGEYETPATNNTATHMDWTFCANNSTDNFHEFLRLRSGSNGGTIQANTANSTSTPSWADIQVSSGAYWSDDRLKYDEQTINHQESLNKIMKLTAKNYVNVQRIMTKEQEEEFENGGNPFSNNPHLNRFNEDGFIAQDLLQHSDLHELVVEGDKSIPHKVKYNDILCLGLSSIKAMDINKKSTMNKLEYIRRRIR